MTCTRRPIDLAVEGVINRQTEISVAPVSARRSHTGVEKAAWNLRWKVLRLQHHLIRV